MKAFEGGAFSYFVIKWFDYCVSIKHIDKKKKMSTKVCVSRERATSAFTVTGGLGFINLMKTIFMSHYMLAG